MTITTGTQPDGTIVFVISLTDDQLDRLTKGDPQALGIFEAHDTAFQLAIIPPTSEVTPAALYPTADLLVVDL